VFLFQDHNVKHFNFIWILLRFGRRIAILLDCLPLTVGWLLTWQARSLEHLYIARTITGVGIGAGVPIASMYLREISTPELRGTLTILMPAAANSGNLIMYILGSFLSWRLTTLPGAILPLLPIFLVFFLPETPAWLISRGRKEDAEKTLCILRGTDSSQVQEELKSMESLDEKEQSGQSLRMTITKLLDQSVIKPMVLLVFLFFTQSFSGSNMVSYYTVTILQMAKIPIDENLAAILVAAQYVVGYSLSSMFVTRIPRRALLFGSLALMMLANLSAGLVLFDSEVPEEPSEDRNSTIHLSIVDADQIIALEDLDESALPLPAPGVLDQVLSMVPVISCILITFGYACGLGPVPFILFGELFPNSVRGSATSITAFLRSITVFLSIKIFPSLLWLCDIWGSFVSCGLVCGIAIGVGYMFVPETKGMDSKQLESIYSKQTKETEEEASQGLMPRNSIDSV